MMVRSKFCYTQEWKDSSFKLTVEKDNIDFVLCVYPLHNSISGASYRKKSTKFVLTLTKSDPLFTWIRLTHT